DPRVRHRGAVRDRRDPLPHRLAERRPGRPERQLELEALPGEVLGELPSGAIDDGARRGAERGPGQAPAPDDRHRGERVVVAEELDGADGGVDDDAVHATTLPRTADVP